MAHRLRNIGMIAALLLVLLGQPGAAEAQAYTLAPEQPSVAAGEWISFHGSGFKPDERVVSWATAPDQAVIGGNYADAEGSEGQIEFAFKVPADAIGGRWSMTAYGRDSKTPVVTTFEVQGREPTAAAPQAEVAPPSGPPGTSFAFAAFGYKGKEKISYWLTGPDGKVYDAHPEGAESNSDGRVDVTWPAPADAPRGTWVITIQGIKSNVARGVPFEIR